MGNHSFLYLLWWAVQDLNLWPPPCESDALPTELTALYTKTDLRSTLLSCQLKKL